MYLTIFPHTQDAAYGQSKRGVKLLRIQFSFFSYYRFTKGKDLVWSTF